MPTPKQRLAAKKLTESYRKGKPKAVSKVMKEAGYSDSSATKPSVLTKSKSWEQLLEEYMPDELLANRNNWLINHEKPEAVNAGLERAYKAKKKYPKDDMPGASANNPLHVSWVKPEEADEATNT